MLYVLFGHKYIFDARKNLARKLRNMEATKCYHTMLGLEMLLRTSILLLNGDRQKNQGKRKKERNNVDGANKMRKCTGKLYMNSKFKATDGCFACVLVDAIY